MKIKPILWGIIIPTLILMGFWIYQLGNYWYLVKATDEASKDLLTRAGLFGDSFGYISCLFSFFTVIGLLITLYLQQKERHDDQVQRHRDQVDRTVIQLVTMYNEFVKDWEIEGSSGMGNREARTVRGRDCFEVMLSSLNNYTLAKDVVGYDVFKTIVDRLLGGYSMNLGEEIPVTLPYSRYLFPYIKLMHHILYYISSSDIDEGERIRYVNLVQYGMTGQEIKILSFLGFVHVGLKKSIEDYGLLYYLNDTDPVHGIEKLKDSNFYSPSAFGEKK